MSSTVTTESTAVQFNQQGEIYLSQGKLEEAIASCEQALKIHPNFAPAYKTLGNALQAQGRMEEARHWYAKAIEIEPNFAEVYANLGSLGAQQQKWQEAIGFYQKALAIKPNFAGVYRNLAKVFGQIGKPEEAQQCWYQAFSLEPEKVAPGEHLNMGDAFFRQEKFPEAIACYDRAIKLDPNVATAYQNLGEALKKQGKLEEATAYYRKAIELNAAHARNGSEGQSTLAGASAPNGAVKQQPAATAVKQPVQQPVQQPVNSTISIEDPEAYKILAEGYFAQGKLEQAIAACKKALQIKPEAPLYKMLGNALQAGGKIDEAKSCYVKAIEINPNFAEAYANYGSICAQQEQWQQAVSAYEKAIALKPDFAGAFRNFAKLLTQLGKSEEAAEAWYRAFVLDPKSGTAEEHEDLAKTLIEQGKVNQGIDCYRRAVELNPNAGTAYHELGEILRNQEQWEAAVDAYRNAIRNNPDLSWSHNNLAESLVKLERWEEAVNAYRKAIELNPDFSWSHNNLADVLLKLERWEEAVEAYSQATQLNPDFSWSHNYLADALIKLERWEEAISAYQRSIELHPEHFWAHNNLAEALVNLERWDEAVVAYRRANEINPNFFWSHSKLGDVLLSMERWEEAIDVYRRAAELNPDFPWTYYNLATAFEKLERWDESIAAYRRAAEIQADLPWLSQKLADALRMRTQWDLQEAMRLYRRAIQDNPDDVQLYHKALEIAPNDADLYVELADALVRHSWPDGAIVFYQMALQIRPDDRTISKRLEEVLKKKGVSRAIEPSTSRVEQKNGTARNDRKFRENLQEEDKVNETTVAYPPAIEVNQNFFTPNSNVVHRHREQPPAKLVKSESIPLYSRPSELNPPSAQVDLQLVDNLSSLQKWDEALALYRRAIELNPQSDVLYQKFGDTLAKQNHHEAAIAFYKMALQIKIDNTDAHWRILDKILETRDTTQSRRSLNIISIPTVNEQANTNAPSLIRTSEAARLAKDVRLIAYYLPQFHPIPENDLWWGQGFTEWTNVTKAEPLFEGHHQPQLPADLGFYDLRLPEVREAQAALAQKYGIFGFCYYYYWFAGKRLLHRPLDEVLQSKKPDFPFCICWANENWTRRWDGAEHELLMAQECWDDEQNQAFAESVTHILLDERYIRINGAPLLIVYRHDLFPDPRRTTDLWRKIFRKNGVGEVHLSVAITFIGLHKPPSELGFDSGVQFPPHGFSAREILPSEISIPDFSGKLYDYKDGVINSIADRLPQYKVFLSVMTAWDNTARRKRTAHAFLNSDPDFYEFWLRGVIEKTKQMHSGDERLVFINAWNEWAEGAHLEPDRKYGHSYLVATRNALYGTHSWKTIINLLRHLPIEDTRQRQEYLDELDSRIDAQNRSLAAMDKLLKEKTAKVLHIYRCQQDTELLWQLDSPRPETHVAFNSICIEGWVISKKSPPVAVEVIYNDRVIQKIWVDIHRPDVKEVHLLPGAEYSGFSAKVQLIGVAPKIELLLQVVLQDKSHVLIEVVHLQPGYDAVQDLNIAPEEQGFLNYSQPDVCKTMINAIEKFPAESLNRQCQLLDELAKRMEVKEQAHQAMLALLKQQSIHDFYQQA
jgi:tetratricopeptide (TPR) repeat protein